MSLENAFETGRLFKPLRDLADAKKDAYSTFTLLPGLRSFWPMSAISETGEPIDIVQGVGAKLLRASSPVCNLVNSAPSIEFDGVDDYLHRGDTAIYDITGTESHIDPGIRGLTFGGWFRHDSLAGDQTYISKYATAGSRSYLLRKNSTDQIRVVFSGDGTAIETVAGTDNAVNAVWSFVVGRFTPSSEIAIFTNGSKATATTAITSVFNSASELRIGAEDNGTGNYLDGSASLCFLCATALPDSTIDNLFQVSRDLFGV